MISNALAMAMAMALVLMLRLEYSGQTINTVAADVPLCIVQVIKVMVLTVYEKRALVFAEEGFQVPVPS